MKTNLIIAAIAAFSIYESKLFAVVPQPVHDGWYVTGLIGVCVLVVRLWMGAFKK